LAYGTDRAIARDSRKGNGLARTDLDTASLTYKVNAWMSIIDEVSYIDTRAANHGGKTFRGLPATQAHSWRNEFGTIFTFWANRRSAGGKLLPFGYRLSGARVLRDGCCKHFRPAESARRGSFKELTR